jgi:hypothetical protein
MKGIRMTRLAFAMMTALIGVPLTAQTIPATDPLQARVTIDYQEAPAAVVLEALATAAGLKVQIGGGNLRPVTITLTNVTLGTALNAVCENASCVWRLQGTVPQSLRQLSVTAVPNDRTPSLPAVVSFAVHDMPMIDAFRALAAALDVPLTVDLALPNQPRSVVFTNASTADVLNVMCGVNNCQWEFDAVRGLRLTPKR